MAFCSWFLTDDQDQLLGASFPQLNETGTDHSHSARMATWSLHVYAPQLANNGTLYADVHCSTMMSPHPGPMPQTKALMAEMGATANNFYIHTPICSSSSFPPFSFYFL